MFRGYPNIEVKGSNPEEIDTRFEKVDPSGCVQAKNPQSITKVDLDMSAVMSLVQHADSMKRTAESGILLGVQIQGTLEVGGVMRHINIDDRNLDDDKRIELERDVQNREREYRSALNDNLFDGNVVGAYSICTGSFIYSDDNVKKLTAQVDKNSPAVLVYFDKNKSLRGRLYLRAFTLTPAFVAFHREFSTIKGRSVYETERLAIMRRRGVYQEGVFLEIPIVIRANTEARMVLADRAPMPVVPRVVENTEDTRVYCENLLGNVSRNIQFLDEEVKNARDRAAMFANKAAAAAEEGEAAVDGVGSEKQNATLKTILMLKSVTEQARHIESVCDSILLNNALAQKL